MALLRLLAAKGARGASLTDVARHSGLPHATVHRLLKQLINERMVVQLVDSRRYALGPMCFELGVAAHPYDLRSVSGPVLRDVAKRADDSVFLSLRSGDEAVCIDLHPSPSPIRVVSLEVGTRRPLGAGAGGLAILGALPSEEREVAVRRLAPQLESDWGLSPAVLDESLRAYEAEGYALIRNRVHAGVSAVGYVIRSPLRQPLAALSVAALNERLSGQRVGDVVQILRQAAHRLEKEIGDAGMKCG